MFILPSFCPHGTNKLPPIAFSGILILEIFSKIWRHFPIFVKIGRNNRHFTKRPAYVHLRILGYYHCHRFIVTIVTLVTKLTSIPMDTVFPYVDTVCLFTEVTSVSVIVSLPLLTRAHLSLPVFLWLPLSHENAKVDSFSLQNNLDEGRLFHAKIRLKDENWGANVFHVIT